MNQYFVYAYLDNGALLETGWPSEKQHAEGCRDHHLSQWPEAKCRLVPIEASRVVNRTAALFCLSLGLLLGRQELERIDAENAKGGADCPTYYMPEAAGALDRAWKEASGYHVEDEGALVAMEAAWELAREWGYANVSKAIVSTHAALLRTSAEWRSRDVAKP